MVKKGIILADFPKVETLRQVIRDENPKVCHSFALLLMLTSLEMVFERSIFATKSSLKPIYLNTLGLSTQSANIQSKVDYVSC